MPSSSVHFHLQALYLPLRTTFKQASSVRKLGESIWCEARRGEISEFGEGCPRTYVTGENVEGALDWLAQKLPEVEAECPSLEALKEWIPANRSALDEHPAAFCAIETALLGLFAREANCSVEKLLGMEGPRGIYTYTAVLGDSDVETFTGLAQRYISNGFTDFKVKVAGNLKQDRKKLDILHQLCSRHGLLFPRIRLDANNLWKGNADAAIKHLSGLDYPLFGIEEPVAPKNYAALSKINEETGISIILDESLCTMDDLKKLEAADGYFIPNIKVSRVGGLIRSLEMIEALKEREYQIIVGAHVGETSVLTRAGMCAAKAAGEYLIAQEGGFGLLLLEKDPAQPSLMFGAGGRIDLSKPYSVRTPEGVIGVPVENWSRGWGLACSAAGQ